MPANPPIVGITLISAIVCSLGIHRVLTDRTPTNALSSTATAVSDESVHTAIVPASTAQIEPVPPSGQNLPWAQFRGPNGQGDASDSRVPTEWSNEKNIIWKTKLVGRGASAPIIVDDNVFVTAYTGYGIKPGESAKKSDLRLHLICIDRKTGTQNWVRTIKGSVASQEPSENFLVHGFASSTPACDGERVYAFFGASGVFAFDIDGKYLWQADVGTGTDNFGSSASPMIYEDLLIVNASIESKRLFAFNKLNGRLIWITEDVERTFSTPVIAKSPTGRTELILNQSFFVHGIDPANGKKLWTCKGIQDYVVPLPIVNGDTVYCSGGKQPRIMAIKLGGNNNVTESHKLWENPLVGNVPTPLLDNNELFVVGENGILQQFSTETGKRGFKKRVKSKQKVFAGLVKSRDHYFVATPGLGISVIDPKQNHKVIATNRPDSESAGVLSGVSISGDNLFYRTDDWIYCVGTNANAAAQQRLTIDESDGLIEPRTKFAVNPGTGAPKLYVRYMTGSKQDTAAVVLRPYDSIIDTSEEREKLTAIVSSYWDQYEAIRVEEKSLLMKQNKIPNEEYIGGFAEIERKMMALDSKVRKDVRPRFSKEQMAKHLKEHQEWLKSQEEKKKKAASSNE